MSTLEETIKAKLQGVAGLDVVPGRLRVFEWCNEGLTMACDLTGHATPERIGSGRLKQLARVEKEISALEARLGSDDFLAKASPEAVADARKRLVAAKGERACTLLTLAHVASVLAQEGGEL